MMWWCDPCVRLSIYVYMLIKWTNICLWYIKWMELLYSQITNSYINVVFLIVIYQSVFSLMSLSLVNQQSLMMLNVKNCSNVSFELYVLATFWSKMNCGNNYNFTSKLWEHTHSFPCKACFTILLSKNHTWSLCL